MGMMNQIFMMVFMTAIVPLIIELLKPLIASLSLLIHEINIYDKLSRKVKSEVVIQCRMQTSRYAQNMVPPHHHAHDIIIYAIEEFLVRQKIFPTKAQLSCGKALQNILSTEAIHIGYRPTTPIHYNNFMISYNEQITTEKENSSITLTMTIQSYKPTEEIHKFIRKCYDEYNERHFTSDINKYAFMQIFFKPGGLVFHRYVIGNKLTFEQIYFPDKDNLLELVNKYRSGELSSLRLMLTGEPGCGKTSIIKAMANLLGYHIIVVKLSFIKNDAELLAVFHSDTVYTATTGGRFSDLTFPYTVPLNKRIYVFEDVDAETDIIHERRQEFTNHNKSNAPPKQKKELTETYILQAMEKKWLKRGLTLSGILNALDGILELHGAVIIMTTNHIEKLDPAFYRPGRITMLLELKKMLAADGNKLICHKFGRPSVILRDYTITPAKLESMCYIARNIDELEKLIDAEQSMESAPIDEPATKPEKQIIETQSAATLDVADEESMPVPVIDGRRNIDYGVTVEAPDDYKNILRLEQTKVITDSWIFNGSPMAAAYRTQNLDELNKIISTAQSSSPSYV